MTTSDKEAADRTRTIIASAMELTDKLLAYLSDRHGFPLNTDVRSLLRDDWIILIGNHLVDSRGEQDFREAFADLRAHSLRSNGTFQKLLHLGEAVAAKMAVKVSAQRFPRPIVCAWCGNRYRAAVPLESHTQGCDCASSVFQVTEEFLARARTAQKSRRASARLKVLARATTLPLGTWIVQGHYGSTSYDCELFRFVKNPPTAPAEPVCDNCIGERLLAGDLEQIEGQFP